MKALSCMVIGSLLAGSVPAAWAERSASADVRGGILVQDARGAWRSDLPVSPGSWVKATDQEATLRIHGAYLRLAPDSVAQISNYSETSLSVRLTQPQSRLFLKVPEGMKSEVRVGSEQILSDAGEYAVGLNGKPTLQVFSGAVRHGKAVRSVLSAQDWEPASRLALDGTDTRRRHQNRRKHIRGEQSEGRRVGEDIADRTPTPSETVSESPSPSTSPSVSPSPSASPEPPTAVEPGGLDVGLLAGLLGGGGLIAAIILLTGDDDDDNPPLPPASP